MKEITPDDINQYCEAHTSQPADVLTAIEHETLATVHGAGMLSGHLQGRFLAMISSMIRPSCIVEIGTFTGYSALCLAEGLATGGRVITIEKNVAMEPQIRKNLSASPLGEQIDLRIGDALQVVRELSVRPELVFIDADKRGYPDYFELALEKLADGGFILADNVLWKGRVTDPAPDARTRAIMDFNAQVAADPRVEQVMLPVRDGLLLIRKKM